jgi:hypothetical protein
MIKGECEVYVPNYDTQNDQMAKGGAAVTDLERA